MLRKTRSDDTAPTGEERGLERYAGDRNPWTWFEDMDRWFDDFRREFGSRFWGPAPTWESTTALRTRAPLVDLLDEDKAFLVRAELPGVNKGDLDIRVTSDRIELSAETRRETEEREKDFFYRERAYGAFRRILAFPAEVIPDTAEASLKDGVFEVRVPKRQPTAKQAAVKVRVE